LHPGELNVPKRGNLKILKSFDFLGKNLAYGLLLGMLK
jgi:hypothetical protein